MGNGVGGSWSRVILAVFALEIFVVVAIGVAGRTPDRRSDRARAVNRTLVGQLRLTDLALWSGASYCRHPSQADLFAPHGDHPSALDHFPAGSVVPPRPAGAGETVTDLEHSQP